jgi:hypothetical protein
VRIVEALFLARDTDTGELAALDLYSRGAGSLVSPLLDFRLDPGERERATARALEVGGDALREVGAALLPGAAITAVLVEHTWAQVLEDAVSRSGGTAAFNGFVATETLADAVDVLVAAARGD